MYNVTKVFFSNKCCFFVVFFTFCSKNLEKNVSRYPQKH